MKLLSFLLQYSRRSLVLAVLLGIISGACNTAVLAVINSAIGRGKVSFSHTLPYLFIVLCLLAPVARMASEIFLIRIGQSALYKLRLDISKQIVQVPLRSLEEVGFANILTVLTDDIPNITALAATIPLLLINASVVVSCLVYMGWLNLPLLGAVLAFMVLGIVTYQVPVMRAMHYLRLTREESGQLYQHFEALNSGIKELKLHGPRRDTFLGEVLAATADRFRKQNTRGLSIYSSAASWGQMLVLIATGILVFAFSGIQAVNTHILVGFSLALLFLTGPLQMIMNASPQFGRASTALDKIETMNLTLRQRESENESAWTLHPIKQWKQVDLTDVSYFYDSKGSTFNLGPVNLSFVAGELVFIKGGNGSGKTTFAKLLAGLYSPHTGTILVDGQEITDLNRDGYRQQFSAVFSDFYLFDSLLGLDLPDLEERTRGFLAELELDHKVEIKDRKLSTTNLSQGQRKRLALLVAYLEDRPIYIFDEWAADQDPVFKEAFYHKMLPGLKKSGKTIFVISHDDRYYHLGDRLLTFEFGQLVSDVRKPEVPQPNHQFIVAAQ